MAPSTQCGPNAVGTILGIDLANPGKATVLADQGAHPAWQPARTGG